MRWANCAILSLDRSEKHELPVGFWSLGPIFWRKARPLQDDWRVAILIVEIERGECLSGIFSLSAMPDRARVSASMGEGGLLSITFVRRNLKKTHAAQRHLPLADRHLQSTDCFKTLLPLRNRLAE